MPEVADEKPWRAPLLTEDGKPLKERITAEGFSVLSTDGIAEVISALDDFIRALPGG